MEMQPESKTKTTPALALSFDDPRLRMTVAGRLVVRIIGWITYLVVIAASFTFLISGDARLRFAGVFLALMLVDLFIHRGEGDVPISELSLGADRDIVSENINVAKVMRPATYALLERGYDASEIAHKDFYFETLKRLLEFPEITETLARLDISLKEFKQKLDEFEPEGEAGKPEILAIAAFGEAVASGHAFVEVGDLFAALADVHDAAVDRLFGVFSIAKGDIERALIFSSAQKRRRRFIFESHRHVSHRIMNRAWTSRPTPTLDRYGTDLTDLARDGEIGFLVGHDEEYELLVEALARPTNPNALLVGEAGIGKEAVVKHLAFRLGKDDVPRTLFDRRLVSLEIQSLVAGAAQEVLSARLKTIVEEIYLAGNIILYIPDIHNLVKTSGTAYLSAADALMPIIMNNAFPVVGATYPKEFKQSLEPRSDFTGAFEVIRVNEISEADAEKILTYEALAIEQESRVTISFGAIKRSVALAKKYLHGKFLPASAEDLLKSALVEAERGAEKMIGPDLVTRAAEKKTHIPIHGASGAEADKLLNLEDIVHKRMVDQEEAVHAVATALREYRSGLARKGGPIASFLFVGPTGVGKTELAKILADIQFGGEHGEAMIRFDMTEYQDKESFIRFIGSSDGGSLTAGHGALTDAVLEKPYSLILLDEFEKAYPDILNLFLQVLDDGRLTDGLGRTIDFTNTIIIATSNAHSDIINDALAKGESMTDIAEYLKKRLVDVFKPELVNRFSKIIIFKNLEPAQLQQIVVLNLAEFAATVKEQGIYIDFDLSAVLEIAKLGYDPAFGARPLRRAIEEKIRAPLAEQILGGKIEKGAKVNLVYKDEKFAFEVVG